MKTNITICTLATSLLLLFCNCEGNKGVDRLLALADSALIKSDYDLAEKYLLEYNGKEHSSSEAEKMYARLLNLQMADKTEVPLNDLLLTDSLIRYYDSHGDKCKYAQSLFLKGVSYYNQHDAPSALGYFQQAISEAERENNILLICWIYSRMGNLYRNQGLTEECISAYRKFYQYAQLSEVSLQKSSAAYCMSLAQTYLQHVDSAILYKTEALKYAREIGHEDQVNIIAISLADLYIQTEQYEKARQIMKRTPEYGINWAYYYLALNKLDSAAYYFNNVAANAPNIYGAVEVERDLYVVEKKRHNIDSAFRHLEKHLTLNDSAQKVTKTREVLQVRSLYDYNIINNEKEVAERKVEMARKTAVIATV